MSYEEVNRKPYSSVCACGKGILKYYIIELENDWGQTKSEGTEIGIFCDYCKEHYYISRLNFEGNYYLVPKDETIPDEINGLNYDEMYSRDEEFIKKYSKTTINEMVADMTAPKHRFVKDLTYTPAIEYANNYIFQHKKRSLKPMIIELNRILSIYDKLETSREKKYPKIKAYESQREERNREINRIEKCSFKLEFSYDKQQDLLDRENSRKEQEDYFETHRYDDFKANVSYHESCRVDSTGHYWDSLYIKKCTDPQYLILNKPQYENASIIIAKKYLCNCIVCGKEIEVLSSDFEILYDEEKGYYPAIQCDCHSVSSFEAKAMQIFNDLGVCYAREASFDDLVGDSGNHLRFDFAVFKTDPCEITNKDTISFMLELQGPHHYKQGTYDEFGDFIEENNDISINSNERIEKQQIYDLKKLLYCADHGIALETIKYTSSSYEILKEKIIKILVKYGFDIII